MSENCNFNCEQCEADCGERREPSDFMEKPHELSRIKKVIGVMSGKGGVGKSLVTSLLAASMRREGYSTAILDADITGPTIPKMFGITEKAPDSDLGIFPVKSKTGIGVMSLNLLLPNDSDPVIWRGPILAGVVKQFWTDVVWGEVDYMFIDMPPGTGDVPLTVFQSIPIDGVVIVTSPQELVGMIVSKAINMAGMMNIPVIGLVENMSYVSCPDCGNEYRVFGESRVDALAEEFGVKTVSKLPLDPKLAAASDAGSIELFSGDWLDNMVKEIESRG
jgi:Mrp family chromosome partitioning ATPase